MLLRTNPDELEELTRFKALDGKTWNHPALVGDRLYVRNGYEEVVTPQIFEERIAHRPAQIVGHGRSQS